MCLSLGFISINELIAFLNRRYYLLNLHFLTSDEAIETPVSFSEIRPYLKLYNSYGIIDEYRLQEKSKRYHSLAFVAAN